MSLVSNEKLNLQTIRKYLAELAACVLWFVHLQDQNKKEELHKQIYQIEMEKAQTFQEAYFQTNEMLKYDEKVKYYPVHDTVYVSNDNPRGSRK